MYLWYIKGMEERKMTHKRVDGIKRSPDMNDNVCTIYYNTNGSGFRVMQTNYMHLENLGPVYRSKIAAIKAAQNQGFTHYFAQWHAASLRPHLLPRKK